MSPEQVARRRAIEALRSGVPSWDAVAALGSGQPEAEDRFSALLDSTEAGAPAGLLLGAGFGAGKSHLLTHLAALALQRGFVVSTVVISKETPLFDPAKLYSAAVRSLVGPGRVSGVLADAADALDPDTPRYAELLRWLSSPLGPDERFAATLHLHEQLAGGGAADSEELLDAVVRFWAGEPIRLPDLRRGLRGIGAAGRYAFAGVPAHELARQRWSFAARLLRAAGHTGWIVLLDEVELIGRYSLLQRGRAYAELARWAGGDADDPTAALSAVLALTDDFGAAVLAPSGKDDRGRLPNKLRDKQTPQWSQTASEAERGIRMLERDLVLLDPPDDAELDRAYEVLRALHGQAYDWEPPRVPGLERLGATRMRQHVRSWINGWDLVRLDPDYAPSTTAVELQTPYTEDADLEGAGLEGRDLHSADLGDAALEGDVEQPLG